MLTLKAPRFFSTPFQTCPDLLIGIDDIVRLNWLIDNIDKVALLPRCYFIYRDGYFLQCVEYNSKKYTPVVVLRKTSGLNLCQIFPDEKQYEQSFLHRGNDYPSPSVYKVRWWVSSGSLLYVDA